MSQNPRWNPHPGAQKRFFDGDSFALSVAAHAYMCADATLTPDQLVLLARHEMMDACDQTMVYAAAAGVDTVEVITVTGAGGHEMDACKYRGMDCGAGPDVIVIHGGDLMQHDRRVLALEPRMFKMEPRMLREIEPPVVVPRKGKKRDWEQRNRKQKRR